MQKLLPIGVRNFEEIRKKEKFCIDINKFVMSIEEDYVYPYVDKTKELLRLVEDNNFCFFANNRKVGKSLTLSTLEAMFQRKDELFEGLYVEDWVKARAKIPNPVLKFDMEDLSKCENFFEFNDILVAYIKAYLNHYNVSIKISPYTFIVAWQLFPKAIKALYKKYGKVVILIDDYDKAMYNNLGEPERIRGFLSSFYLNLETCSKYLKFVMITGYSDVNKIALLSGLNNLKDISESEKYTDIFGFTQKELENNFIDWIKSASEEISVSKIELLDKMKEYKDSYGDFAFNLKTKLYNPFSVLYFLKNYKESLKQVDENKDSVKKLVDSRTKVKERVENNIEVTLDETVLKQLGYEVKYKRNEYVNDELISFKKNGIDVTDLVIPSTYSYEGKNYKIVKIGKEVFNKCLSLKSVTIPNGVTEIGDSAFHNCYSLISVIIPDSVTKIGDSAFKECFSLTNLKIPDGVTKIGNKAFYNCCSLISVTIPNSVTKIENKAFEDVPYIEYYGTASGAPWGAKSWKINSNYIEVILDKTVLKQLGYEVRNKNKGNEYANYELISSKKNGEAVTDLVIPSTYSYNGKDYKIRQIVDWTFSCFQSLTSVIIPDTVTEIGKNAFNNCSSLTNITIPDSVTKIGDSAFECCSSLTNLKVPDGVTEIENYTFYNCCSLISLTIPNSVRKIGNKAFNNCSSLTNLKIPNSVTEIGDSAFENVPYIEYYGTASGVPWNAKSWKINSNNYIEVTLDETVLKKLGYEVRYEKDIFGDLKLATFKKNREDVIDLVIPLTYSYEGKNYKITQIDKNVLAGCQSLKNVIIPNGVTKIRKSAFKDCSSLESVTIPNTVTKIDENVFDSCKSLKSIMLPNSITEINRNLFDGCSSLTDITIPDSVTSIEPDAFSYCSSLKSITIPNSVIKIGTLAFYSCKSLTNITIPNSVTKIDDCAFKECINLKIITLPNSVQYIGDYVFDYCSSLTDITIPNSVTSIGNGLFRGCSSLESITIPSSIKQNWSSRGGDYKSFLFKYFFEDCKSLISVTISDNVIQIGEGTFKGCSLLKNIKMPNSVTKIDDSAFEDCSSLTSIIIPENVTEIGEKAFKGC